MGTAYTIGELAETAGIPTSTLRYYERIGLVEPVGRTDGNYRVYDDAAAERVRFIRAAQATGLTLDDISELLAFRDGDAAPCAEVEALIDHRLADVKARMAELRQVQRVLKSLKNMCEQTENKDRCEVIESFTAASGGPATAS